MGKGVNILIFSKKDDGISKIKRALVLEGIFSETTYVCLVTNQISSFSHNSNEFWRGGNFTPSTSKWAPKKPTQIRVKDRISRDIRNLFEHEEEDYYKPIRISNFWSNNYIEYKSKGDRK